MNLNRMTIKAQESLEKSRQIAENLGHQEIQPLHLLQALLADEEGLVYSLLKKIEVNINGLNEKINAELKSLPRVSGVYQTGISRKLNDVLNGAEVVAKNLKDEYQSKWN